MKKYIISANSTNQLLLYRQYYTYILNCSSTKAMLDFSLNKEVQQAAERHDFFTNRSSEKLYIDKRLDM